MIRVNGEILANKIKNRVKDILCDDKYKSIPKPHIVVIQVGDNPIANLCIENKRKTCEEAGIKFSLYKYKESVTTDHLKEVITKLSLLSNSSSRMSSSASNSYFYSNSITRSY